MRLDCSSGHTTPFARVVEMPRRYYVGTTGALSGLCAWLVVAAFTAAHAADFPQQRQRMVEEQIASRDVVDERVLAAMLEVPRHRFVPEERSSLAYADTPLPIGQGQTISQPYIVAKMTELLQLQPDDVVFELGTGSGYQSAVASRLVKHVYSMEIVPSLAQGAQVPLSELGYDNVTVKQGDGYYGWSDHAPFDAVVVTAAATHIPPALVEQLKPGGRMVLPVGPAFATQRLMLVEKDVDGEVTTRALFAVRFVPVTGDH